MKNDLRIAAEFNDAGVISKEYVYGTSINSPDYVNISGVRYRFIKDHLGSPRLIVKSTDGTIAQRMDYSILGQVTNNTKPGFQAYGFAGGLLITSVGLTKFGARWYDPNTGRWTSKDPIGFDGGDMNLYGYVLQDPINLVDPKGESYSGFAADAALIVIDAIVNGDSGKGRSTEQLLREAYTREIIFDTGDLDPSPGAKQCPIPKEKETSGRLVPFRPKKGIPDHTWRPLGA
ncbi:RHS repeat domain-containing protein [Bdellovibrio sp. HCB185ZH]|uniref:RHS repeat domain-containing protein n=1 Tax=Bdellovibrio sp. HCB185ZH TaxID=3394235 RepID=UPI0039A5DC1B